MTTPTTIPPVSSGEAWIEYSKTLPNGYWPVVAGAMQEAFDAGWEAALKAAKWARDFEQEQYRKSDHG